MLEKYSKQFLNSHDITTCNVWMKEFRNVHFPLFGYVIDYEKGRVTENLLSIFLIEIFKKFERDT